MSEPFHSPLDKVPMFAGDLEIAEAIVGEKFAKEWVKTRLPTLAEKPSFPPIDALHGGRPVPLVRRFYESYLGLTGTLGSTPRGVEDPSAWRRGRKAPRGDR